MLVGVGVDGGGHGRPPGNSLSNEYLWLGMDGMLWLEVRRGYEMLVGVWGEMLVGWLGGTWEISRKHPG